MLSLFSPSLQNTLVICNFLLHFCLYNFLVQREAHSFLDFTTKSHRLEKIKFIYRKLIFLAIHMNCAQFFKHFSYFLQDFVISATGAVLPVGYRF